ncbi:MAG: hypothetical protein NZ898_00665 [Myxococcota bacterium]|nr:hypothetical protein [Myxococcota bacterium]MDW8362707.1 hypothetical protein [Myxococcales bacterium]
MDVLASVRVVRRAVAPLATLLLPALVACGGEGEPDPASERRTWIHAFEPFDAATGTEIVDVCQSWTLHNDEPLWVTAVRMENDGAWHHSNWFFVPESVYRGPDGGDGDGTWPCAERGFDQVGAASAGGVLFAQSTQARAEEQRFAAGAAIRLPARVRIVGSIHVLNLGPPIRTGIRLTLETLPESEVRVRLAPLNMSYFALDLPPRRRSAFAVSCDFETPYRRLLGRPLDFGIYYVLPHYHTLAEGLRLELVGGPNDGQVVFSTDAAIGDPLGRGYDPPFSLVGATGLRLTCAYDNPRDERVVYDIGDQEMCDVLVYTDSPLIIGGWARTGMPVGDDPEGVALHEGHCEVLALRD